MAAGGVSGVMACRPNGQPSVRRTESAELRHRRAVTTGLAVGPTTPGPKLAWAETGIAAVIALAMGLGGGEPIPMLVENLKVRVKSSPVLMRAAVPLYRAYLTGQSHRPIRGPIPQFDDAARVTATSFKSAAAYADWRAEHASELAARQELEVELFGPGGPYGSIDGSCAMCGTSTSFGWNCAYTIDGRSGTPMPNVREMLYCARCGLRNRVRGALHVFLQEYRPTSDSRIFLTEQYGLTYRWLRGRFPNTAGSEYLPGRRPGEVVAGIRHEDLCDLAWPDATFDFVVSLDVLEHVGDVTAAFESIHRCLKPGGRLLFTAPFDVERSHTLVRARIEADGSVTHFCEPEYHGNPTDPASGSLALRVFGWDTLEHLETVGYESAEALLYWSRDLAYLGGAQVLLTARRAP